RDDEGDHDWDARFIAAVRMVARIKVITHPRARLASHRAAPAQVPLVVPADRACSVVAIGASTGGPGALVQVLGALPPRFALPIVIVLHIDPAFAGSFAEWLAARTGRSVSLAVERERLDDAAGRVLLAPPNVHVAIEGGRLRTLASEPRNHCRPSVDVLFESLARDRGAQTLACLLTGMGRDGAEGMLAVRRAGGLTIAQDEATSVVYGMPREAVLRGAAERVLPLHDIGPAIAAAADRTRTR
ncbi:MAG: CheB methylesterase domain-containing protein, partial [Kofleriaceae bacterium]